MIQAILADAIEINPVRIDRSLAVRLGIIKNGVRTVHLKVKDALACGTDKMRMPRGIRIKMVCSVTGRQLGDFSEFSQ